MIKFFIITLTAFLLFSCVSGSGGGGSLSDAFEDSQEDHGLPPSDDDDDFFFWPDIDDDREYDDPYEPVTAPVEPLYILVGGQTSYQHVFNNDIKMGIGSDFIFGDYDDRLGLFFLTGLAWNSYIPDNSDFRAKNDSLTKLNVGLNTRYSLTNRDNGIYLDLFGDFIVTNHYWQYRNTLPNGDSFDGLIGLDMGLGLGICFYDNEHSYLLIDPSVGVNLMGLTTHTGLQNDVFKNHFYFKIGVKALFGDDDY